MAQARERLATLFGSRASLNLQPNSQFIGRIQRRETGFYMLSWGVPTFDALYSLQSLTRTVGTGGVPKGSL